MKDSQLLIQIYRRYLEVTGDLITVLERHFEKMETDTNEVKEKRESFVKHAQGTIDSFHDDLHKLCKMSWEIKELENEK